MSGHSKWHNIKRKKEAEDSKRGKIFTKMSRQITVAAREGGGDPNSNPSLRLAIDKAKQAKMPKENIERAIQRGLGVGCTDAYEEAIYEGFGPSGGALMVYTLTDNKNRTVADIKNLFSKCGGSLGQPGSTAYIFSGEDKSPSFNITIESSDSEQINKLLSALEDHNDVQEVYSNYEII